MFSPSLAPWSRTVVGVLRRSPCGKLRSTNSKLLRHVRFLLVSATACAVDRVQSAANGEQWGGQSEYDEKPLRPAPKGRGLFREAVQAERAGKAKKRERLDEDDQTGAAGYQDMIHPNGTYEEA